MTADENKRMLALACTVADLKTENMYLAQRVQELVDEYNNVAHQLNEKKWSNDEAPSKQTLDELQQMRERCGKLERENKELEQRVHQLVDENDKMACQLNYEKAPSKQTLDELQQMREQCDKLEKTNKELRSFAKAMNEFVKDKNIYMRKGTFCGYKQGSPAVCSSDCLECDSCLGVIDECGVICRQMLYGVKVKSVIQ